jgi:hypothetical protein
MMAFALITGAVSGLFTLLYAFPLYSKIKP